MAGSSPNTAKGVSARNAALTRLKEAHMQEFTGFLREERERVGLPADPGEAKKAQQVERLFKQLNDLGINIDPTLFTNQ